MTAAQLIIGAALLVIAVIGIDLARELANPRLRVDRAVRHGRARQVRARQVRTVQQRTLEVRAAQVRAAQIEPPQVALGEVDQIGRAHV